jgi:hypothetical protein
VVQSGYITELCRSFDQTATCSVDVLLTSNMKVVVVLVGAVTGKLD